MSCDLKFIGVAISGHETIESARNHLVISNGWEAISNNINYKEARSRAIEQFGDDCLEIADVDLNDKSAPQRNELGFGSAHEALRSQPTEGDPMNDGNVEAPSTTDPPQTEEPGCLRMHHHAPAWHLDKEPTIVRDLVMLTESWIFAHFPKLPGIPKHQNSDVVEYCTRWKWDLSITDQTGARDLLKYREAFDNYKVDDMELSGDPPNVGEHEQYLLLRDENKALVEQILALNEEV
ncbi:hypothetical protein GIB67_007795 [Kingdonia uniflora]|uniref:Uncharacterized protein n=1 Tax=Kingdonia uniflora TaxID=39325 RepID=A0A7J7N269_9MAGN|nr:hypothetical protein GIB67_007795 [Kingdonia uniflora]